jgi:hypothetical protein
MTVRNYDGNHNDEDNNDNDEDNDDDDDDHPPWQPSASPPTP